MDWGRWWKAFSAVLLLGGLAGHAHASDSERVRAVFSSNRLAAVIAVPRSFLSPETIADEGEIETQADWATYLNRWVVAVKGEVDVVVVPMEALGDALPLADPAPTCVSLFRRSNGAVVRYDEDCVVGPDIYEAATHWLHGENVSGPAGEALKRTPVHIRHRCSAAEAEVPVVVGMLYDEARRAILAAGWKPMVSRRADGTSREVGNDLYGNPAEFWKRGYKEVAECAPTGLAPCNFHFRDVRSNVLVVSTSGEEREGHRAVVTGDRLTCRLEGGQ